MADRLQQANSTAPFSGNVAFAEPRRVPFDAPWEWLAAGWRDLWAIPRLSLGYGAVFSVAAAGMALGLWSQGLHALFLVLAAGFLLIGPLFGVGLYAASRALARGEGVKLSDMLSAGTRARGQLAFFGILLMFAFMAWLQLAILLFMVFMGDGGFPPPQEFLQTLLFTSRGLVLLIVGTIAGGVIAALVFSTSVVAVPLLMVEPLDTVSAMRASLKAVLANPKPMALWAGLITMMIGAGFATLLVGLVIALPLIGHATWHAYADIYGKR